MRASVDGDDDRLSPREPIAIVGIGCRLPGGVEDARSYWRLLLEARDAIVDVPRDRWSTERFHSPDPAALGRTHVRQGGFLSDRVDQWDAQFFGVSPREAAHLDPQQRLLLELTWESLEDAGIVPASLAGTETGVYVGGFTLDSQLLQLGHWNRELIDSHTATSATLAMLSNRISYFFDLRGPSLSIDTACSSSLVSLHYACQDLWEGRVPLALAGGVNVMIVPEYTIAMSKGGFLSPHGRCRSFAKGADGYVRGEGGGVLVLKPLASALVDRDPIHALVLATGVNQDGRTPGITVPRRDSQERLIRRVCSRAGVAPSQLTFIEAHGTGTAVGDRAEIDAIGSVVGSGRSPGTHCLVGSVKANIGHLEAAAGVAGLIKVALCLEHRRFPPQPHQESESIEMPPGLCVPTSVQELPNLAVTYAGINAFGYGGTNAHAVLASPASSERHQERPESGGDRPPIRPLVPLSASSTEALRALAERYLERPLEDATPSPDSDRDLFHAMACRRSHHRHRLALRAGSAAELRSRLQAFLAGEVGPDLEVGRSAGPPQEGLVFVYTGMGAQSWGMCKGLWREEPVFRRAARECDEALARHSGRSIATEVFERDGGPISENWLAQQSNFLVQVALTALWKDWGIEPSAVIGHSVGEVAACFAAGCLDLESAAKVSFHRSRIQQRAAGRGGMLHVELTEAVAAELPEVRAGHLDVAAVNSDTAVTLSGGIGRLEAVASRLEARGVFCRTLQVEIAYHSSQMDGLREEVLDALADLQPTSPRVDLYSTVSAERIEGRVHDASYWWSNVRRPVRFRDAVQLALKDGRRRFLEIGPHRILSASIRQTLHERGLEGQTLSSLDRARDARESALEALGALYKAGFEPDWANLHPFHSRSLRLPAYPWRRQSYWIESRGSKRDRIGAPNHLLLGERIPGPRVSWVQERPGERARFLAEHQVHGAAVFPAAALVESALTALTELDGGRRRTLSGLVFRRAFVTSVESDTTLRLDVDERERFSFSSCDGEGDDPRAWRLHATGHFGRDLPSVRARVEIDRIQRRCEERVEVDGFYARLRARGLEYGPSFRTIRRLWRGESEVFVELATASSGPSPDEFTVHPALLDGAFQALYACLESESGAEQTLVPTGIAEVAWYSPAGPRLFAHGRVEREEGGRFSAGLRFCDELGKTIGSVDGLSLGPVLSSERTKGLEGILFETRWIPLPAGGAAVAPTPGGTWILFSDRGPAASAIEMRLARSVAGAVRHVDPSELLRDGEVASRFDGIRGAVQGAVYAPALEPADEEPSDSTGAHCARLSACIRALASLRAGYPDRFLVLTAGVQCIGEDSADDDSDRRLGGLGQAALWGIGRVLMNEVPQMSTVLLDLPAGPLDDATLEGLERVLRGVEGQDFCIRGNELLTMQVVPTTDARVAPPLTAGPEEPASIDACDATSGADVIEVSVVPSSPLAADELELEPESMAFLTAGLALARGSSPGPRDASVLTEALCRVSRLGAGTRDRTVGSRTVFLRTELAPACAWTVRPGSSLLATDPLPAAATGSRRPLLPYVIAHYVAREVLRLKAGDRVLVASDDDEAGSAAVCIARLFDADARRIRARAPGDRTFLGNGTRAPVEPSPLGGAEPSRPEREADSADALLAIGSPPIPAGIASRLRAGGHWVQVLDAAAPDSDWPPIELPRRELTYVAIDPARLVRDRSPRLQRALDEVCDLVRTGRISLDEAIESDRADNPSMDSPAEIGSPRVPPSSPPRPSFAAIERRHASASERTSGSFALRSDGTYLVTGGFGGLGAALAEWLAARGAGGIVLLGRRGMRTPGADRLVARIEAAGSAAFGAAVDVGDLGQLESLREQLDGRLPPVRGVFHCAGVLDDGFLESLDAARFETVLGAKARGAWNLHWFTRAMELEHFVLISSLTALVGTPGQANYAAANCYLDALAHRRRANRLPGLSLNLGLLLTVGMGSRDGGTLEHLRRMGVRGLDTTRVLSAIEHALGCGRAQLGIFDVDWELLGRNPWAARMRRFADLVERNATHARGSSRYRNEIRELPLEERADAVDGLVRELVCGILRMPPEELSMDLPLLHFGFNSLMAVELQLALFERFGSEFSPMELISSTPQNIARRVLDAC